MTPVAKIVSELFMIVLSALSAPSDMKEFRLDLVNHQGGLYSYVVRRTDAGLTLLEQQGDKLVERGTIRAVEGKPSTFVLKLGDVPEQTFDFAAGIPGFSLDDLRKSQALDLKAADGVVVHVRRSGTAAYLTPEKGRMMFVCH